jgi:hypothetical protein
MCISSQGITGFLVPSVTSNLFLVMQKYSFIHSPKPTFFPPKGQISEAGDSFRPSPLEDGFQPLLSLAEATSSSSTLLGSMLSEANSVPKEEAIGRAWAKTFRELFFW